MAVADKLTALRIKANLIADRTVGLMEINTEVHDGIAVLTGEVENEQQKQIAEDLAYQIDGVSDVENHLQVITINPDTDHTLDDQYAHLGYGPLEGSAADTTYAIAGGYEAPGPGLPTTEQFPGEFSDEDILREVAHKLESQHQVDISQIRFCVDNQIVVLTGKVATPNDVNQLLDIVLSARGVMGVSSEVDVIEGEIGTQKD